MSTREFAMQEILKLRIARLKRLLRELDRHERKMRAAIFEVKQPIYGEEQTE